MPCAINRNYPSKRFLFPPSLAIIAASSIPPDPAAACTSTNSPAHPAATAPWAYPSTTPLHSDPDREDKAPRSPHDPPPHPAKFPPPPPAAAHPPAPPASDK